MQPGDVPVTYEDTTALEEDFGFKPQTSLREGLRKFAQWYLRMLPAHLPAALVLIFCARQNHNLPEVRLR